MDLEQVERHIAELTKEGNTTPFADVMVLLQATVMIELIKLLRAENANRQENGRTSKPD